MTELEYYQAFVDWLERKQKINQADLDEFDQELDRKAEAEEIVKEMFRL